MAAITQAAQGPAVTAHTVGALARGHALAVIADTQPQPCAGAFLYVD